MSDSNWEKEIYSFWEKNNFFNQTKSGESYSLLMPPPNLTGELHLGHAMQHSIMDAIARYKRLVGFNVLLLPGVDHAGIQFEATFEKKLARENLSKEKLGREKWMDLAWKFKDEIYNSVSKTWRMMGLLANWDKEVFTLDEKPRKAVFAFFKKLWEEGLVYKGPYIVQWCPKDQTAIEDVEMDYEERKEKLYFVRYKIIGANEFITVATARPETIAADVAIAIYPNHPKYKDFVKKKVLNPFTGKEMLVIEDERVQKDFGTGALKITPGHDLLDYEIGKDHNLDVLQVVDKRGKITELDPNLAGLKILEAREKAEELLGESVEKVEDYTHSVPVCERCKSVVEPLISEEWFVKMDSLAKSAIKEINANKIKFLPKNYSKISLDWLENIHDWCISRSLWWGHRIPVWYKDGQETVSLESLGEGWKQEEKVLDTWFSSGLWPLSTLGWPEETEDLKNYFPWDFEISAPEIKYLWIARMIMISVYLKKAVPFKTMFFHGMLRDLMGRKFSKSLGNGIEPNYLIDNWGVDATRMTLFTYSIPGRDGRVSKQILDERGKNFRNFATKIRNIARFIYELKEGEVLENANLQKKDDREILNSLDKTIRKVTKNIDQLELHLAVEEIYNFVWHEFADKYLESSKSRRRDAQITLEKVFETVLVILHPFMPFATEDLYKKYVGREESILKESWPVTDAVKN